MSILEYPDKYTSQALSIGHILTLLLLDPDMTHKEDRNRRLITGGDLSYS